MELAMDPKVEEGIAKPNVEWKDGPVCPVVTDTNEFAKVNRQIVDDVQKETSANETVRGDNNLGGLEPIL